MPLPDPLPLEIDIADLAVLRQSEDAYAVLDVREPWELALCKFPESIDIPLGSLAGREAELPTDRPIVVVCRSGKRSLNATQHLRAAGIAHTTNLRGGVLAWGAEIDPSWPAY